MPITDGARANSLSSGFQRICVTPFKAVFMPGVQFDSLVSKTEGGSNALKNKGIFISGPNLKEFLTSGPAVRAGIWAVFGYMRMKSGTECRNEIKIYVDDGETEN